MFERTRLTTLRSVSPQRPAARYARFAALSLALTVPLAAQTVLAQTAPAQTAPAAAPTAPVQAAPATPVTPAPATRTAPTGSSNLPVSSALAVEVSAVVKGRLVACPKGLKLSGSAVCLYTQNTLPILRSLLRSKLSGRILSDWKTGATEKSSSLVIKAGSQNAFVLLAQLSATETLVVVDGIAQTAATPAPVSAQARPAMPAGIVKGQQYVLDTDLKGLVNVVNVGGGSYRLASVAGGSVLTVNSGVKSATFGTGKVELALAPVSDGRNLLFPVDGLRALACTVTPAQVGVTVACGSASANIRPIVF
ncbi:hypothetical protein [Deinococcus altitudinis]|uniref:hypothetical protein n=1 Tax=Deinococcus altitudinis TaxID=468914 RepID=UPI0038929432